MLPLIVKTCSSSRARLNWCVASLSLLAAGWAWTGLPRPLTSAEPDMPQLFNEQLAAGEFAPALRAAEQIDDPQQRDNRLVELAKAQARAGGPRAATSTLASVYDDRTRNDAVLATRSVGPLPGARGGQANFNELIDMITSTVRPDSWEENSGKGTIEPFRNGVYVDPAGVLKRAIQTEKAQGLAVARLAALEANENTDSRRSSQLRKVSLPRLEKFVQLSLAAGRRPSDEMLNLAGLEKIKYVLVYPETGDLVLAGPASDWRRDEDGRHVSRKSGRPVLQLDDLVTVMRYMFATPDATFGCSINPTTQGLARTKQFAEESSAKPLKPGQRPAWLKKLREQMGQQSISVEGLDPRSRAAQVLVEADYRMKLVGMGLEQGTVDVPSYLDLVKVKRGEAPPALDVLRWWFTLKYDALAATQDRDAFEIRGSGVQVLSENELLTQLGERVHTGKSEIYNQEFAQRFTTHFASLAQKYPVYADLQNIFDLALVSALIQSQQLGDRVGWHFTCFGDAEQYQPALGVAPTSVDSVINHRMVDQKNILVGVSGGVHVAPWGSVTPTSIKTDTYGKLQAERNNTSAKDLPRDAWWWD